MRGVKTPAEKLRKVRDMLRAGYTMAESARVCGVSPQVAQGQAHLMARFEGFRPTEAASRIRAEIGARGSRAAKHRATLGSEYDAEALDLVSLFNTPRTPRQLRRFMGGDDG